MVTEISPEFGFVVCSLVTWRITHLVVEEDGPWDIIVRLRARMGDNIIGQVMDCFYCTSLWVALPLSFVVAKEWLLRLLLWPALSAAASLLEQATTRESQEERH